MKSFAKPGEKFIGKTPKAHFDAATELAVTILKRGVFTK